MALNLDFKFTSVSPVETLVEQVEAAQLLRSVRERVFATKAALERAAKSRNLLGNEFLQPTEDTYARRPLYIDPEGRFSILVMVWGKGQGTPLHNHGGLWVVECVYEGRMRVTDYRYEGIRNGLHQFSAEQTSFDEAGAAGYRIPPEEHHVLENDLDGPSVTIHVFGGILEECKCFAEVEGGYAAVHKRMAYTRFGF